MFNLNRIANQAVKAVKQTIDRGQKEVAKASQQAAKQASNVSKGASQFVRSAQSSAQQAMSQAAKQGQTAMSAAQRQGQSAIDRAKTVANVAGGNSLSSNFVSPTQAWENGVAVATRNAEWIAGAADWTVNTATNAWDAGVGMWNATEGTRTATMNTGEAVFDYAKNLVTSDEAWGESIGVDNGKTPRPFGYGKHGVSLLEGFVGTRTTRDSNNPYSSENPGTYTQELAAKVRLFGDASWQTLSASIGLETENGFRNVTINEGQQSGWRFDIDLAGTIKKNVLNWTEDLAQRLTLPRFGLSYADGQPTVVTEPADSSTRSSFSNPELVFTGEAPPPVFQRVDVNEGFLGLRGRTYAEIGILGGSIGAEGFLGLGLNQSTRIGDVGSSDYWRVDESQLDIGVRTANLIHADVYSFDAFSRVQAGIDARYRNAEHYNLFGDLGFVHSNDAYGFAGVVGEMGARLRPWGGSIGAEVFAGVKAGVRKQLGLAWDGYEFAHVFGEVEGHLGVGAVAKAEIGFDGDWYNPSSWDLDANAKIGVAAGVGGSVKVGFGLFGKDIYDYAKNFDQYSGTTSRDLGFHDLP